ncbi:MAG: hypothetical protein A2Y15_04000 [Clostridiales bacterium GWF2_36_10]|nr:MAG: hypothetical protein A2Y15_04000 [Clostridiales bacterium GWF2_36_10]HAN20332.1 hypothetical protein [Clostridiales bacterium]
MLKKKRIKSIFIIFLSITIFSALFLVSQIHIKFKYDSIKDKITITESDEAVEIKLSGIRGGEFNYYITGKDNYKDEINKKIYEKGYFYVSTTIWNRIFKTSEDNSIFLYNKKESNSIENEYECFYYEINYGIAEFEIGKTETIFKDGPYLIWELNP